MRIVVQDYGGYPFPLELSGELAKRGHKVWHIHFADLQQVKAGCMMDSYQEGNLTVIGLSLGEPFQKYNFYRRRQQELMYGDLAAKEILRLAPDVVLSAGAPLEVQKELQAATRKSGARFYFWMQDVNSFAVQRLLPRRVPVLGHIYGWYQEYIEKRLSRTSDGVVFITKDFLRLVDDWKLDRSRCYVIENWAPLEPLPSALAAEDWARKHGLVGKKLLIYSGTLGMKHNPSLLLELAKGLRRVPDAQLVVVSSGPGIEWLREAADKEGVENLTTLGFQPIKELPHMLAAASLLVAILEPDASVFSVPSKVLTYLAAGRPILLAVPSDNLASRIVHEIGAGRVADPKDSAAFAAAGCELVADEAGCEVQARSARAYAERTFDIREIARKFEEVLGYGRDRRDTVSAQIQRKVG